MGFYDCRCMVTGVSLKGADAALVLLQEGGGSHHPIALAIKGNYNRLGTIDNIDDDDNTKLVLNFFLERLRAGEFVVDTEYLRVGEHFPIENVEQLLYGFERNINDYPTAAMLNGKPIVFALIARAVWDGLAKLDAEFRQLFDGVPATEGIYCNNLAAVSKHVREMSAVNGFLAGHRIAWKPADNPSQDYPEEMRLYLAKAREAFRDSAVILDALKEYEREVRDLLGEDE